MIKRKIKLNGTNDVKEFVTEAGKCQYDVDVYYNRVVIDAKSILGVLSMDLARVLTVSFDESNKEFDEFLDKYAAA